MIIAVIDKQTDLPVTFSAIGFLQHGMTRLCQWESNIFDSWEPPINGKDTTSVVISRLLLRLILVHLNRIFLDRSHVAVSILSGVGFNACQHCPHPIHTNRSKITWLEHMKEWHRKPFDALVKEREDYWDEVNLTPNAIAKIDYTNDVRDPATH